jgi:HK97 gp10 family phage protein
VFSAEVTGLEEFEQLLTELADADQEKAVEKGLIAAMAPVAEMARVLAPRRAIPTSGGHMADSIGVYRLGYEKGALTVAVSYNTDHFWGWMQEFGAPQHGAHPFLRPAWDAQVHLLEGRFREVVFEEIQKIIDRYASRAAA